MNVGEMQRKLSQWAEQDKGRKFYDLYSLVCDMDWLRLAHDYVAQNAGSKTAGCDGINMKEFDENLESNLQEIQNSLKTEEFEACPVRRVYIPKANGKVRPLGIPSIRDRIVQEALRMVLEPIYEADFSPYSFGFRPTRCTMDAITYIRLMTAEHRKLLWVIEGDISAYFDTINHRRLTKILRRRINDAKLLNLIWKFLRAGVMEKRLFKDTKLGTPQGGIISPLLANVYLHELDKHMQKYTGLSKYEKNRRRNQGLANFVHVRYADDFVILCNGTKAQAEEMREEVYNLLTQKLRLSLSMEKTKITHLNDGFEFLGFQIQRSMGHKGMTTKVIIPDRARKRHLETIKAATAPNNQEDSLTVKFTALNRIIGGWCRYYQHTNKASVQFAKLAHKTFWLVAHWLGRKYKLTMPQVMLKYAKGLTFGTKDMKLLLHSEFHTQRYTKRLLKPNPYTNQAKLEREKFPIEQSWMGYERRPGWYDQRLQILERDGYTCRLCGKTVTSENGEVDHIRQYKRFKLPVNANRLENLRTVCIECHRKKTKYERQMESPVR